MTETDALGANVRRRRRALGLTLDQLADASGVSATMLSEVERSVKNPTVKLAYQIARALGCSLTDLVEDESTEAPTLVRAAGRRTLVDPESRVERHGLSPEMHRRGLELVWYSIPPGRSAGEMAPNRRGILEHATVIRGALTIVLGDDVIRLATGDGITYRPHTTVEYKNDGRSACHFILLSDATRAS
jgi:transcriptional regulator with XRE-family HTH domain